MYCKPPSKAIGEGTAEATWEAPACQGRNAAAGDVLLIGEVQLLHLAGPQQRRRKKL